uniref:peptidylprolyl isomerase n=1 Tax=Paulinella longichromatophora TaxID=1708747 RepID=A0A2H4ZPG7_9EUKA|nr:trigger factor [Paulinella longichromatophora]
MNLLRTQTSLLPKSRIALKITIPAEYCQVNYNKALSILEKDLITSGLRKGNAPNFIGLPQIDLEKVHSIAVQLLIEFAYSNILKQKSINPIGQPELNEGFNNLLERFDPNTNLSFTIETDVEPNPILNTTVGLAVTTQKVDYDPSRIDKLIKQARLRLVTLELVKDRPARIGDIAVVSLHEKRKKTRASTMSQSELYIEIVLDEQCPILNLVENTVNLKIGESKDANCQVPLNYSEPEGEFYEVDFKITLKGLRVQKFPSLDDVFAKQISDKSTLKELRSDLEDYLQEEAKLRTSCNLQDALLDALVEELEVEIPETLLQQEIHNLIEKTANQIAQKAINIKQLFTPELIRNLIEISRPEAETLLRKSLALKALAKAEKIEIDIDETNARIAAISQAIKNTKTINQDQLRSAIVSDCFRYKLVDWLRSNSIITTQEL